MPNLVCLWRKCYFFFDMKLCLLKIAIRREKFDKKSAKMGPSERPKFARRSAWFLVTSPVVHSSPGAAGVLYCSVLFSDTIDRAEKFNFKKNGGKYSRTEFWSGCIRRRWRKGQELSLDSDNDDGDLGDFDPEAGENQVPRCRWHVSV